MAENVALRKVLPYHLVRVVLECTRLLLEVLLVCKRFHRTQWRYYDHPVRLPWMYFLTIEKGVILPPRIYWSTILAYQSHHRDRSPLGTLPCIPGSWPQVMEQVHHDVAQRFHNPRCSPALVASRNGHVNMMMHLYKMCGVVDETDATDMLVLAAQNGSLEDVQFFLDEGFEVNNHDSPYCKTALHAAARRGHLSVVQCLLGAGAKVEAPDRFGNTPLHMAAHGGHVPVIKWLMGAGANLESVDKVGYTPLHHAVLEGQLEATTWLVEAGAETNAIDVKERTPLHLATYYGQLSLVKVLVRAGANVDSIGKGGCTPLHVAVRKGPLRMVQWLVKAGANVDALNTCGQTPQRYATLWGQSKVVRWLEERRKNVGPKEP